jgi:hypothetical protein
LRKQNLKDAQIADFKTTIQLVEAEEQQSVLRYDHIVTSDEELGSGQIVKVKPHEVKDAGLNGDQKRRSDKFDQSFILFSVFHLENSF